MSTRIKYDVEITRYAKKKYIKSFRKKYYSAWDKTIEALEKTFKKSSFKELDKKDVCDEICKKNNNYYIVKYDFKISWSNQSAKDSWNRMILYIDEVNSKTSILFVYNKNDHIWPQRETVWWKNKVKKKFKKRTKKFDGCI